jgi:hypothetical protein
MSKAKPGLLDDEFAQYEKENPPGRGSQCRPCHLPANLRALVDKRIKGGSASTTVSGFLKKKGHAISPYSLRHHAKNHLG